MIEWGRIGRGRVWHLLDRAAGDTWCRAGEQIVEWTRDQPPLGARPCPRCCSRVQAVAAAVTAAQVAARQEWIADAAEGQPDEEDDWAPARPVEDVDLVGALAQQQVQLACHDEGPDPQADDPAYEPDGYLGGHP